MMSSLLKVWLQMEETLKKFLDKSQFPEDPEVLKEMIVTIAQNEFGIIFRLSQNKFRFLQKISSTLNLS
jgi:hypothetical protein